MFVNVAFLADGWAWAGHFSRQQAAKVGTGKLKHGTISFAELSASAIRSGGGFLFAL